MSFTRLPNGLLEGVDYRYTPDGRIDWRSMIKAEYLAVQSERKVEVETRYRKAIKDLDLHTVEDYYLIILLGGIKDLLRMRGARAVRQTVDSVTDNQVVCTCSIDFVPNFETGGEPFTFTDVASASVYSVSGVFQLHLAAIAANRAFVRCVRNGLGIGIAGKDEFDVAANKEYLSKRGSIIAPSVTESADTPSPATGFAAQNILEGLCRQVNITFDMLKTQAAKYAAELKIDPATWTSFVSVQDLDAYVLIGKIKEAKAKRDKVA